MITLTLHTIRRGITMLQLSFLTMLALSSCVDMEELPNTTAGNTEALWRIMDERYCFFSEKKTQLGTDWDEVHSRYTYQAENAPALSQAQLLEFLSSMLATLRDGHVNLSTSFDFARNWSWKEDYPTNLSDSILNIYLGTDYKVSCGIRYRILDDNTGYMYVETFDNSIGDGNLDQILYYLMPCSKLIIDVRGNGGGKLTEAQHLASRFTHERTLVGYIRHKTGPGHDDFSDMREQWIEPSSGVRWNKPVCVLTNRAVYSAANEFVKYMKRMPQTTIVGDITGGGSGMPYSAELPNGWSVRFSACPMYGADGECTEFGIEPDVQVGITPEDYAKGIDTIIETARHL